MADLIGLRLGNYEITRLLGEGGMATVYRARQITMARDVAIKVIKTSEIKAEEFTRRFEREAKTVAALNHPHILKVFDFGQQDNLAYLVMELQPGGSLAELIAAGPLPIARATRILEDVGSALDYAHRQGLVHRDLKPQNILFDSDGNAILSDFGIAKLLDDSNNTALTQAGAAIGTPIYMAPELWQGGEVDGRTDLYALGVVLFQMLSGQLPFSGDTPFSIMHKHIYELPPAVVHYRPELMPAVDTVIQTALAKDRDQRYRTASEMEQAFKTALSTPALTVVPPTNVPVATKQPAAQIPTAATNSVKQTAPVTLVFGIVAGVLLMVALVIGGGLLLATRPISSPTTAIAVLPTLATVSTTTSISTHTAVATATLTPPATVVTATANQSVTGTKLPATLTPVPTSAAAATTTIPTAVPRPTATPLDSALVLQTALAQALTQTATIWTSTITSTNTRTSTLTPSITLTSTSTATATDDLVGTAFRLLTSTAVIKIAALNTQKALPTATVTPSITDTPSPSPTARPSTTPSGTITNTASNTASPKPTSTPTYTLSPSSSKTPLPTDTPMPTSSSTPRPSATPPPSRTSTLAATVTVSTAVPGAHIPLDILAMTVTARAEGTPGAGATDTPFFNGEPLLPATMKVSFSDSFYDNNNNWPVYSKPDVGTVQIANNLLQFALKPYARMTVLAPVNAPSVSDFYFRTLVSYSAPPDWSTTSFGLIIHQSDAGYDFIDIRPGSCIFALNSFNAKNNTVTTISVKNACQTGSQIKAIPFFVLVVIGSNNQFTVYVNNTKEAVLVDTAKSYSSGNLGVYAISSQTNGFNVAFTDIAIAQ